MGDSQDQRPVAEQLEDLRGYAKHRGMDDADDWLRVRLELELGARRATLRRVRGVNREQDVQDLRDMLGSRHIGRCSTCDRYKFTAELCPHCNESHVDRALGRYVPGVISTQSEAQIDPEVLRGWASAPMGRRAFGIELQEAIVEAGLSLVDAQVGRDKDGVYVEVTVGSRCGVLQQKVYPETTETWTRAVVTKLGDGLVAQVST